jgi:hypothetical protein
MKMMYCRIGLPEFESSLFFKCRTPFRQAGLSGDEEPSERPYPAIGFQQGAELMHISYVKNHFYRYLRRWRIAQIGVD